MSLPFLKHKQMAGVIIHQRKKDGSMDTAPEAETHDGMHAAAEALLRAVTSKDAAAVATALRDAFEILDSEPHVEGPHLNEEE